MCPRPRPRADSFSRARSIDAVVAAFAAERAARLDHHVLFLLELCVNNYGHRNLDAEERAYFERAYHDEGKLFFELFGPDKLVPELPFFSSTYLETDVHTSERVVQRAPHIVRDLTRWLVDGGFVTAELLAQERARHQARFRLRYRLGRLTALLAPSVLSLDPRDLGEDDLVPHDHYPVSRLAPRRLWLSVFPGGEARDIGPIVVPERVSKGLRCGWSIASSLGRVGGRWRFVDLAGIYPRV